MIKVMFNFNNFLGGILALLILISPVFVFADTNITICDEGNSGKICNPLQRSGVSTINGFIKVFLEGALKIGIPLIALAVIYSGFLFVAARGNPESITKAKDTLLYTLIGAAILLGSWAIAKLISETVLGLS